MEKTKVWLSAIVGVLAVSGVLHWSIQRDQKIMVAAEAYEQCVKTEYNTTPTAWYEAHGEYPICQN